MASAENAKMASMSTPYLGNGKPDGTWNLVSLIHFHVSYLLLVSLLGMIAPAFGAIEIETTELGFDRIYKRDRWVPLQVVITSQNEAFDGEIRVEVRSIFSGELIQAYSTPLSLTRADRQRRTIYLFLPGISTQLTLQLMSREGHTRIAQEITPEFPKRATDLVMLALTPKRDVLSRWHEKPLGQKEEGHAFVAYADFTHLPAYWKGYDSVDVFVLRGVSLAAHRISARQQQALLDWIQRGGTLLVSGGIDFRHLRGSFLEPFLPVDLVALRTETHLTEAMQRFGFEAGPPFDLIEFKRKPGTQMLVGNEEQIYVAKRSFGSGQIINLAFDYNVPPFSESPGVGEFWTWLLKAEGRSPRYAEARYEAYRKHNEKIQRLLTSRPSTQAPLIQFLAAFLSVYVLSFVGLTWWAGKRKAKAYWIGGVSMTMLFTGALIFSRNVVPSSVSATRFSILSIYPQRARAHLQTYIGLLASASTETQIQFEGGTFIKPLTSTAAPPLHLVEAKDSQLRRAALDPWVTRAYIAESFIDFPIRGPGWHLTQQQGAGRTTGVQIQHHLSTELENVWLIDEGEYTYFASIPPDTRAEAKDSSQAPHRFPSPALSESRKQFIQILASEGVLRYLIQEAQPKLVGWTRESFLPMTLNHPVNGVDETFVILYADR
ncbi:MAG: hypothetical protein O7E52_02270 [Candidatus Poribacteria bacterium]|nr:hypothetical protein [Candidatus Poribacteria bacterium]